MPRKPLIPCKHPGCPELTHLPFCERHRHQHERATSKARGYDNRWRIERKRFLKEHPFCERCKVDERLVRATVVDHIKPHRGDQRLFWNRDNWQALCKKCHDHKTMTEDRYQEYTY